MTHEIRCGSVTSHKSTTQLYQKLYNQHYNLMMSYCTEPRINVRVNTNDKDQCHRPIEETTSEAPNIEG